MPPDAAGGGGARGRQGMQAAAARALVAVSCDRVWPCRGHGGGVAPAEAASSMPLPSPAAGCIRLGGRMRGGRRGAGRRLSHGAEASAAGSARGRQFRNAGAAAGREQARARRAQGRATRHARARPRRSTHSFLAAAAQRLPPFADRAAQTGSAIRREEPDALPTPPPHRGLAAVIARGLLTSS